MDELFEGAAEAAKELLEVAGEAFMAVWRLFVNTVADIASGFWDSRREP